MNIDPGSVQWSAPPDQRADCFILLTLHGHGMNESMGVDVRHQFSDHVVVASLRAPLRSGAGYGWFPLDHTLTADQVEASASAVLSWMDDQQLTRPVGILGFSQGACTAFQVVRREPERFRCAVNLSGFVSPLPHPGDSRLRDMHLPTFYGRGLVDSLVPDILARSTADWLRQHTQLTERTYPGLGHGVNATEIDDVRAFVRDVVAHTPPA